ncbi:hypothetical protein EV140_2317 [Microcella alkaliphila]|uniref:Uncharacterized protein n=1 Tax=Microcella alkaliphila TaxID=279828 RepID=A0A4V2FMK3_9MICO|nr:hypothetical protein EV140_2317 [Microcella alkaliphila]
MLVGIGTRLDGSSAAREQSEGFLPPLPGVLRPTREGSAPPSFIRAGELLGRGWGADREGLGS